YYPFFIESQKNYYVRLHSTINLVAETDLPSIFHFDYHSVQKIKKLLAVIARVAPYKPNIQKLAQQIGSTRDTLLKFLFYLEKARIVKWLGKDTFGINYLNKPEKLFLDNTNLMYALSDGNPNIGSIREVFFINQLAVKHSVNYPSKADFLIDKKYLFEVGGKNKTSKQIAGLENAYIAADEIEHTFKNIIPLWMFGFLY
ncbi:MAG: AAA family ATPase, partial [Bacteroidales bacterium]|nr:AAA family ATPase [Bacteroidales bacterium]